MASNPLIRRALENDGSDLEVSTIPGSDLMKYIKTNLEDKCRPARPCTNASYPSSFFKNEIGSGTIPGDGTRDFVLRCKDGFFLNIPDTEEIIGKCVDGK